MAEKQIAWASGEGYITIIFGGDGNGSVSVSSDANESIDRETIIAVRTTAGTPERTQSMRVKQVGLREVLYASDGLLRTADGQTLNVLKV